MAVESERRAAPRCVNHPDTETNLRCSRCERPICFRCVIQTPVGGRCRECAHLKKAPMFQVGRARFLKATGMGLAVALAGGYLLTQLGPASMFSSLLLVLLGYLVGEAVSRGAGRRISRELVWLAGGLTVLGVVFGRVAMVLTRIPESLPLGMRLEAATSFGMLEIVGNLFGLLFLVLAVVVATSRVR